jgi:radical SAM enzyme (TIGR01210 family)
MCDLWKNTLTETVSPAAIPKQISFALTQLAPARQLKLYNSGSFFDPRAIPLEDYPTIAEKVRHFERIIVESHPAFIGEGTLRFRDLVFGELEVAMGLETAHPAVLEKLNKRMTLEQFAAAAEFLRRHGIALRVFLLVNPPFIPEAEALPWVRRGVAFALQCGAAVVSLIPTRPGNGALEILAQQGQFHLPRLATLEQALAEALASMERRRPASASATPSSIPRIFADLWDLEKFSQCDKCFRTRWMRLRKMNHTQEVHPRNACEDCGT